MHDRLFQAFQTADRQGGTGLGLAISAELVRAHQGSIMVASSGSTGTSFVIVIPDVPALAGAKIIPMPKVNTTSSNTH
jgi:signal transduction histidine kinase